MNSVIFIGAMCILLAVGGCIWSFGYFCGQSDGLRGKWYYNLTTNTVVHVVNKP